MRLSPFLAIVLATAPAFAQDRPIIHAEKGIAGPITVEKELDAQRPIFRDAKGNAVASGQLTYRRLLINGVLWGSQVREFDQNVFDIFAAMSGLHPLENVVVAGAMHAFDIRAEPTTYYHRTGPAGAIFKELRTRKNGADAKSPIAKLGLETGSELAYALPDQKFTVYETDPAVKRLVADTDEYFTYVTDAKKRGAEVEIRIGDRGRSSQRTRTGSTPSSSWTRPNSSRSRRNCSPARRCSCTSTG